MHFLFCENFNLFSDSGCKKLHGKRNKQYRKISSLLKLLKLSESSIVETESSDIGLHKSQAQIIPGVIDKQTLSIDENHGRIEIYEELHREGKRHEWNFVEHEKLLQFKFEC